MSRSTRWPGLLRPARQILDVVRSRFPLFEVGAGGDRTVALLRHADVSEVLARQDDFSLAHASQRLKACGLSFSDAGRTKDLLPIEGQGKMARRLAAMADERLEAALRRGPSIDALEEYAVPATSALFELGFGLRCPGEGRLLANLQVLGRYL